MILLDYINNFFLSSNKKKFVLGFLNIVDLLTIIPIFIEFIFDKKSANLAFIRIWRFVRFLRFFRLYKIFKVPSILCLTSPIRGSIRTM